MAADVLPEIWLAALFSRLRDLRQEYEGGKSGLAEGVTMTLATILIIAYMPEVDPDYMIVVANPSHAVCEDAMELAEAVWREPYPDMEIYCRDSTILWSSPVPRERGE